jgi:hemolysin activation/secretion protein
LPAFQLSQVQIYAFVDGANLFDRLAVAGFPQNMHAASAGGGLRLGWLTYVSADLTVAKAIDGPRDDTRFFFSLTGRY